MAKHAATGSRSSLSAALARVQARVDGLAEKDIAAADRRAIASVRRRFEPVAKRVIRQSYNVRAGDLSGKFQVRSGSADGYDYLELFASTRKLPLERFGARWGGRKTSGATAQIREARDTYDSAFIRTLGGKREVLVRQFSADSNSPSGRDPRNKLRRLRGPSPLQMVLGIDQTNARLVAAEMNQYRASEIVRQLAVQRKRKG
jgi:hypothetical protein